MLIQYQNISIVQQIIGKMYWDVTFMCVVSPVIKQAIVIIVVINNNQQLMDTSSIVKRIIQLKKVSVQLKQSTEDTTINHDLLKRILKMGKQINVLPQSSHSRQGNQKNYPFSKQQQATINRRKESFQDGSKVFESSRADNYNHSLQHSSYQMQSSFITGKTELEPMTPAQEISYLKNQNSSLQQEIYNLRERLKKLQQIQRQQRDEQWKEGLPYFQISIPKIRIFYTKLTIAERDYDKIDYSYYSAQLGIEKIVLTQLPQPGTSSRPPKSITLQLTQLKQVNYVSKKPSIALNFAQNSSQKTKQQEDDSHLVVYHFKFHKNTPRKLKRKLSGIKSAFSMVKSSDKVKQQVQPQIIQTLFIKFDSQQQLKQWDLGVYINYKIVEELGKPDFKDEYQQSMNNSSVEYENSGKVNSSTRSRSNEKNNSNFDKLFDRIATKNNPNEQDAYKKHNQKQAKSFEYSKRQEIPQTQKNVGNGDEYIQNIKLKKDNNNIKIRDEIDSPVKIQPAERGSTQQIITKQRSDTSQFGPIILSMANQDKKQTEQQRIRAEQVKRQKLAQQMQEQKKKDQERMEAMKKTQYELSVKRAKQSLRKGYPMTKYARFGLNPHEKRVYLNEDGKRLCWEDVKSNGEPKWIPISDIESIRHGQFGKGIEAHAKQKELINQRLCFVVINLKSQDRKNLQLKSKDQLAMEQFCKELSLYKDSLSKR